MKKIIALLSLLMFAALLVYGSLFRSKLYELPGYERNNPADPGASNYQGYETEDISQSIVLLNTNQLREAETHIARISNIGWMPLFYWASEYSDFYGAKPLEMPNSRIMEVPLIKTPGFHRLYFKFQVANGNYTTNEIVVEYQADTNAPTIYVVEEALRKSIRTNEDFSLNLAVTEGRGYWSTNGSAFQMFPADRQLNLNIDTTTILRFFAQDTNDFGITLNTSATQEVQYTVQRTIYVSVSNVLASDANTGTRRASPVKTIQTALDKKRIGEDLVIYVERGLYTRGVGLLSAETVYYRPVTNEQGVIENTPESLKVTNGIVITNSAITIYGGWDSSFTTRKDGYTIVDGSDFPNYRPVYIDSVTNVVLDKFIIRNGNADLGGGLCMSNSRDVTITGGFITNCDSSGFGGALASVKSEFVLLNMAIAMSRAGASGGGIYAYSNVEFLSLGNMYSNVAQSNGGAAFIEKGEEISLRAFMSANSAVHSNGGGLFISKVTNFSFSGYIYSNYSGLNGGAVFVGEGMSNEISGTMYSNYAVSNGGGVYGYRGYNHVIKGYVCSNWAHDGGGVFAKEMNGTGPAGRWNSTEVNKTIIRSRIFANLARHDGGGLFVLDGNYIDVSRQILDNVASNVCGGAYISGSQNLTFGAYVVSNWGYQTNSALHLNYLSSRQQTLIISNAVIGGHYKTNELPVSPVMYGIYESGSDIKQHILVNTSFMADHLDYLYREAYHALTATLDPTSGGVTNIVSTALFVLNFPLRPEDDHPDVCGVSDMVFQTNDQGASLKNILTGVKYIYVDPVNGHDTNHDGLLKNRAFKTLQAGLNQAGLFQAYELRAVKGIYTQDSTNGISVDGFGVRVVGGWDDANFNTRNFGGPTYTILNPRVTNVAPPYPLLTVNSGSNVLVEGFQFVSNNYYHAEGAIFLKNARDITITNCVIYECTRSSGGAIDAFNSSNVNILAPTVISNCSAYEYNGGAIAFRGVTTALITISNLQNNYAKAYGGAAFFKDTHGLIVSNLTVSSNISDYSGGGFCFSNVYGSYFSNVTFYQNYMQGGYTYGGGAVAMLAGASNTFRLTAFSNYVYVSRAFGGGALYMLNSLSNAYYLTLFHNYASNGSGGGMSVGGYSNYITGIIASNYAQREGGGLCLTNAYECVIAGDTNEGIFSNYSATAGGGILIGGNYNILTNIRVYTNRAPSGGGVIIAGARNKIFTEIASNYAFSSDGGGLMIRAGWSNEIWSNIIDNYAERHGGGVAVWGNGGNTFRDYARIQRNKSKNDGGGIYINGSWGNRIYSTLATNVGRYGGGIAIAGGFAFGATPSVYNIVSNSIFCNSASNTDDVGYGGGIYLSGGVSNIIAAGCSVYSNFAYQRGGGIYSADQQKTVISAYVASNQAWTNSGLGGGMYVGAGNYDAHNTYSGNVEYNIAATAGGTYSAGGVSNTFTGSNVFNVGVNRAGGFYVKDGKYNVFSNAVLSNRVDGKDGNNTGYGGGFALETASGFSNQYLGEIAYNKATNATGDGAIGGGMYINGSTRDIIAAHIHGNESVRAPGIYVGGVVIGTFIGGRIVENTAYKATSGIYVNSKYNSTTGEGSLNISNAIIGSNNTLDATNLITAIYLEGSTTLSTDKDADGNVTNSWYGMKNLIIIDSIIAGPWRNNYYEVYNGIPTPGPRYGIYEKNTQTAHTITYNNFVYDPQNGSWLDFVYKDSFNTNFVVTFKNSYERLDNWLNESSSWPALDLTNVTNDQAIQTNIEGTMLKISPHGARVAEYNAIKTTWTSVR